MDKEMKDMFNLIINEIGRVEERTNKRFDSIDNHFDRIGNALENMHHEVNACKLERESISILIKTNREYRDYNFFMNCGSKRIC